MSRVLCILLLLPLFGSGCGYTVQGRGSNLPSDIHSVAIPIFGNQTIQTGAETEVARGLIDKFISAKRLTVAEEGSADALLTGTVKSYIQTPIAVTSGNQIVTGYRATLIVEFIFRRKRDGVVLWKSEMSEWRTYNVDSSLLVTDINKREAIRQISVLMAERVHEFILENF